MNPAVFMYTALLVIIFCHEASTSKIPGEDVEDANVLTSFVLVDGNKEYRWLKDKSGEPPDEDTLNKIETEGDIIKPPEMLIDEFDKRKVVATRNLWPDGIVPWSFNLDKRKFMSPNSFSLVRIAILTLEKMTCLKFPRWTPGTAYQLGPHYLDIGGGPGCASYVGYYGKGPQPVLLNERGCIKVGVILHELCHSIGLYHEHSRTDRDKYISILFKNVKTAAYNNFKIHSDSDNYALYDLQSIMHYGPLAFSRGSEITIQPKDPNLSFLLGQRSQLSFYDIKTITEAYQCTRKCPKPHLKCTNEGFLDATCRCHCPIGLKGDDCSLLINSKVCGGVITLTKNNEEAIITFKPKSNKVTKRIQCYWLIKGPRLTQMQLELVDFHLLKTSMCKQWLEIRYNVIGQNGPKYCGDSSGMRRTFVSTSNLVMLSLESLRVPVSDARFTMNVKLLKPDADINCTFEVGNDMCIFHLGDNNDFDWSIMKGSPPPNYTGPVSGHNGSLRYLYVHHSPEQGSSGLAILESQYLGAGNKCITFYYNIYGTSPGQLTLTLITENGENLKVFQGNQSNTINWKVYTFSLQAPLPFKVIIKANVSEISSGVLSIDDLTIKTGTCSKTRKTVKRIVNQIECGFNGDACNFSWQPPSVAKLVNSSLNGDASLVGSLVIFTWSLKDGEKAIIVSPVVPFLGPSCLSVDYYIIGVSNWNVYLSVTDPTTSDQRVLWSSNGINEETGRNNRIIEEIDGPFRKIQICLNVLVPNNSSSASLLAIDHIRLTSSPCNKAQVRLPFVCDFTQWCGFAADYSNDWKIESKGAIFGPFTGSYFRKKKFLLYEGIVSKSSDRSTVTSPPIYLLGDGCLSFNFFARGILLKGIRLLMKTESDTNESLWDSSKFRLMVVWSRIQIPLVASGEFRIIFSTIGRDMFANYAIDNLKLYPTPCKQN